MSDYIYYNNFTDTELLELVEEHYYSIGATGAQAMATLLQDVSEGMWEQHGVPVERMKRVIVMFSKSLTDRNAWSVMAGVVSDEERKKRVTRIARKIKRVRR